MLKVVEKLLLLTIYGYLIEPQKYYLLKEIYRVSLKKTNYKSK